MEAPGPRCRLRATSPGTPVLAVIGPRPSGCPFPTCGCILSLSLAGPGSLRLPPHCDWPLHDRGRYKPVQCSTMGRPRNFDPVTYQRYSHPLSQPLPFLFDPPSRFFLHPTLSSSSSPPSITTFFPPLYHHHPLFSCPFTSKSVCVVLSYLFFILSFRPVTSTHRLSSVATTPASAQYVHLLLRPSPTAAAAYEPCCRLCPHAV